MSDYEQATPQQKLNIANYFIKSTPINEVKFALADVEKLIADPATLNNDVKAKILREYNLAQLVQVEDPSGNKFLLTPFNENADGTFFDAETGKSWSVDHVAKAVKGEAGSYSPSAQFESLRAAVSAAAKAYITAHYKKDKCVAGVFVQGSTLIVVFSAINTNLNAFWTGNWRAQYKIELGSGSGAAAITGKMEVNVHYFEDGNVQLNAANAPPAGTQVADVSDAEAIIKAIGAVETDWQGNLEKMYIDMHHQTFKAMRRALPLSKQTMNWTTGAHALAEEIGGSK